MKRIWDLFPVIAARVRADHEKVGLHGHHDWVHAFRVGEIARQVALEEWGDERLSHLAGISGLCHNADRLLQKEMNVGRRDVPHADIRALLEKQLATETMLFVYGHGGKPLYGYCGPELYAIVQAVLQHDGKNSLEDSSVLIALMDGDRVVNLDTDLFPRSGQYYHELPVVDYRYFLDDPEATYRNHKTVLRDIAYSLDWANPTSNVCVRTCLGKEMVKRRVTVFQMFFDALQLQLEEEGMKQYPF